MIDVDSAPQAFHPFVKTILGSITEQSSPGLPQSAMRAFLVSMSHEYAEDTVLAQHLLVMGDRMTAAKLWLLASQLFDLAVAAAETTNDQHLQAQAQNRASLASERLKGPQENRIQAIDAPALGGVSLRKR